MTRQRLIIEGYGCSRGYSIQEVYDFFEHLSRSIEMRILVPPIISRIPVLNAHESIKTDTDFGVSGHVIWLESGAQIHTWPEHRLVTLDVYSCKRYDEDIVKQQFINWFDPIKISVGIISWKELIQVKV